jgi:hypothetical protein
LHSKHGTYPLHSRWFKSAPLAACAAIMSKSPSLAAAINVLFEKIPLKNPPFFLLAMKFAAAIWMKFSKERDVRREMHLVDEECDQRRAGENKLMANAGEPSLCKQTHSSILRNGTQCVEFLADERNVHRRQRAPLAQVPKAQRFANDVTHSCGTDREARGHTKIFEIFSLAVQ